MRCQRLKVLSSYDSGFVGVCEDCDVIHLSYNNLMINFSLSEFTSFRRMVKSILTDECLVPFPDGSERVILRTPFEGVCFTFLPDEALELTNLVDEAFYMREIYDLIHHNQ